MQARNRGASCIIYTRIQRANCRDSSTPKKKFKCNECHKLFGYKSHLTKHMTTHSDQRPFKCTVDDCQKEFKRMSVLEEHIKWKHSNERPLACDFLDCNFRAKTPDALRKHKKVHSDDKPSACSDCDYKSKWKKGLAAHRLNRHSKEKTSSAPSVQNLSRSRPN